MPDENTNLDEGQVPSPEQAATDDKITLDDITGKKPEELLELYNNAREMRKSATQKFMEISEKEKQYQAERDYLLNERQRKDEELKRLYDQYSQLSQQAGQQQTQPSPRSYDEMTPDQAYNQLFSETRKTKDEIAQLRKEYQEGLQMVSGEVKKTQRAIEYREFLKKEIFPKYEFVTERDIDDWFTSHPNIDPNAKTVHLAADEIQRVEDAKIEARVQARLKAKAEKAKEAQLPTAESPLATLEGVEKFIDLTPAQQQEQIAKDWRQSQGS